MQDTHYPFTTRIKPRGYELDVNGHVAAATLLQYGQHARWESLQAAGITYAQLRETGVGPVSLEETIRYRKEVGADDELEIGVRYEPKGSVLLVHQRFERVGNGDLTVEIEAVTGLFDLASRKLLPDPYARWQEMASDPTIFAR